MKSKVKETEDKIEKILFPERKKALKKKVRKKRTYLKREPPLNKCALCGSPLKWGKGDTMLCTNKKCELS